MGISHNTKIVRAMQMCYFYRYPATCNAIFSRVPNEIIVNCTANQIALIAKAIDNAYHDGQDSTGADMISDDCVWVNKLNMAIHIGDKIHACQEMPQGAWTPGETE